MTKHIMLLALLGVLVAGTAVAGDYAMGKAPTSFRGLAWGTALEDVPELLPVKKSGFKNTYFRHGESLSFGDAAIQSVAYYFRKDRLYRVGVAFSGRANHFLIKERLLSMYGPGRTVGSRYGWMWPEFSIEIDYDDDAGSGGLYYTYEGSIE
ncbi:hypothetical protein GM415_06280 [Pseudodesulfovibrio cashew]|uniref:Uncharacterized protein n=1 Tax=Pseudodesulfovibrio cashew TaxID=2678688 RepID=A0A6I6JC92_9BACT|nr:hypothetical protein [Pseudodesulfovibrio cashew]QGY39741.1 hypothetical protein GM415_06280 [Pseudodesulfovibrio cashew]